MRALGLALGGGAARGLAHLGILEVLDEAKIPIACIAGTSFGALCGGVYAYERSGHTLTEKTRAFIHSSLYHKMTVHLFQPKQIETSFLDGVWRTMKQSAAIGGGLNRSSVISNDEYRSVIDALIPDVSIEELSLPFAATAVDLRSSAEVIFRKGSLRRAVMASAAIPGLFPPQAREKSVLVDGSWADCVPVEPAKELGADVVVAVDVTSEIDEVGDLSRSLEIAWVANNMTRTILKNRQLKLADLLIRPKVDKIHWADFSQFDEARQQGRLAAQEALPKIQALLEDPPKKKTWF
jgi:NTE family protein